MEILTNIFNTLFVVPLTNVLVLIYLLLEKFNVPYPMGFSIIGLTVLLRLLLWPFTAQQLNLSRKMQEITPEIDKIKKRYKGDSKKIQEHTMLLYKEKGINPLGGCLPQIIQIFILFALYGVIRSLVEGTEAEIIQKFNAVLYFDFAQLISLSSSGFFGLPLGKSPAQLFSTMPLIVLIPIVTATLQFLQSKMMLGASSNNNKAVSTKTDAGDFQATFQKQVVYIIPITIGFVSWSFPIGLALYWNTFSIFGIIQQYTMMGWGGLTPYVNKIRGK